MDSGLIQQLCCYTFTTTSCLSLLWVVRKYLWYLQSGFCFLASYMCPFFLEVCLISTNLMGYLHVPPTFSVWSTKCTLIWTGLSISPPNWVQVPWASMQRTYMPAFGHNGIFPQEETTGTLLLFLLLPQEWFPLLLKAAHSKWGGE